MKNKELKFETLKKSYKKRIIIGSLAVCVIGSIFTFATTRAKYKLTQDIKLVTGTVNYKVPDMRIVAVNVSEDGENYEIQNEVPTSGYTLNKDKSVCKVATEESGIENAPIDNNVTIEYEDGKVNFLGVTKRNTRCYLYFDKIIKPPEPADATLAKLNITNVNEGTPDFSKTATTNEGVFKAEDGMYGGTSYYWRGAVTNNYVKFANFCWRIVRINGDGSMRLIYNGSISNNICQGNGNSASIIMEGVGYYISQIDSSYVGWTFTTGQQRGLTTESDAKSQTEIWYNSNLKSYDSKIVEGKFCNDRNVESGQTWSARGPMFQYAARERLSDNKKPSLSCDKEDVYVLKIGAITADEVSYAGGVWQIANQGYYLYDGYEYWTMTPSGWDNTWQNAGLLVVSVDGKIGGASTINKLSLRPVINLSSDVTISSGDGSQSNPFIVQ